MEQNRIGFIELSLPVKLIYLYSSLALKKENERLSKLMKIILWVCQNY